MRLLCCVRWRAEWICRKEYFQQTVCNTFCHVSHGRESCSLQRQIRVTAFFIDNTGDGNISGWRQIFLNAGSGRDGSGSHEDRTDMFIRTKRSINSYDRAVWMLLFYFRIYILKIQCMGGMMQRTVDIQRVGGMVQCAAGVLCFGVFFFQDGAYERAKAVADDAVCTDAEDDRAGGKSSAGNEVVQGFGSERSRNAAWKFWCGIVQQL